MLTLKSLRVGLFAGTLGCALASHVSIAAPVVHSFGSGTDGQWPYSSLVNVNGELYGTTYYGGANGDGTVFAVNRKTGAETVLYSFCTQPKCADGAFPQGDLVDVNGTLYGTTFAGGSTAGGCYLNGCGIVFALNPTTGAVTLLHAFGNSGDGQSPNAGLIDLNGQLYGTTTIGGTVSQCNFNGCGTVFTVDPMTGAETVLYSFCSQQNCTDGDLPFAGLIDVNGTLYGTTYGGGFTGHGTVFGLNPTTGAETVAYSFCNQQNCRDGEGPYANLIYAKGRVFGTTYWGGANAGGTVFTLYPTTGAETVLYSFCSQQNCADGQNPIAGVIDVKGTLYGTTWIGGANSGGEVFSLNPTTGAEQVIYSFCSQQNCTDGANPYASLINVRGALYGTTIFGGANDGGTVFALTTP